MKKVFEVVKSEDEDRDFDLVKHLTDRQSVVIALNEHEIDDLIEELRGVKESL